MNIKQIRSCTWLRVRCPSYKFDALASAELLARRTRRWRQNGLSKSSGAHLHPSVAAGSITCLRKQNRLAAGDRWDDGEKMVVNLLWPIFIGLRKLIRLAAGDR